MECFQEDCVKVYKNLSKIPTLTGFTATKSDQDESTVHWEAVWSQRDLDRNNKFSYRTTGTVDKSSMKVTKSPYCTETNGEKIVRMSNSGKMRAIVREVKIKDEKVQFLEIWEGSCRLSSTNLTDEDKHGVIHSNVAFCCLEWSHNDEKLLYVGERKKPKSKSFFKKSKGDDADAPKGEEFIYTEEWGEQLGGSAHPIVVLFDVKSQEITPLEGSLPDEMCAGEAIWSKDDKSIIMVGWKTGPWKLGLIHCKNRPSAILEYSLESKNTTALTNTKSCVFAVRLTPDGSSVICLESECFGPHLQCSKMIKIHLTTREKAVLVDAVRNPLLSDEKHGFNGLYLQKMPRNTWNGDEILLTSLHRSNVAVVGVNVATGKVRLIKEQESNEVLSVCDGMVFVHHSSPNTPPSILFGSLCASPIQWSVLDSPSQESDISNGLSWKILQHKPCLESKEFPGLDFESIFLQPCDKTKHRGVIINPHGGPHTTSVCGFDLFTAGLCMLGYAVLKTNYRGSLGFGQDSVYSLPGYVGTQDVSDVHQAASEVVKMLDVENKDVYIHGGSHGGFLTLQLIGQHPDFYAKAAVRNPVTNIATMLNITDIQDWCLCETGEMFQYKSDPKRYDYTKMVEMSPISHVSQVKAPLLMMLGSADLRVPPSQGHEYAKALKSHGGKVKLMKYDDNDHPIGKVDAEANCFMNMALWFYNDK